MRKCGFYVGMLSQRSGDAGRRDRFHRDDRLRIVVHDRDGPTTKADCLNRLYEAMCEDERRGRFRVRSVILHDAEDMVHPAALSLLDSALDEADFVQLPVRPEPQRTSRWIGGHYCDEFAEAHGKVMVVRDWLGAGCRRPAWDARFPARLWKPWRRGAARASRSRPNA
jgi:adsorption protein B